MEINYKFCQRLFVKYYGTTPKRYIRHRRLYFALIELNQAITKPNFIAIVTKYGFHDQAHLIREFNYLTGGTPLTMLDEIINCKKWYQ